jgi:carbamoyltransferase
MEPLTNKHQDIAASLQRVTEEIMTHLLRGLKEKTGHSKAVIVGGCAMNSVANGKFTTDSGFSEVYVPVGAADNGTAIGAAFYVWNKTLDRPRSFVLTNPFLGQEHSDEECAQAASKYDVECRKLDEPVLLSTVIDMLLEGLVVGWFQGREEFGARALGNRTLLADPRRVDMRDIINLKIKFREKFRPFAPSILEEAVPDWFEIDEASPFMERVLKIREEKRKEIPAVTHVDGSGRLQSVSKKTNPLYWRLIKAFEERTGVPLVLNTSLNENEPIVHTPEQAIECFLRTRMDAIVLGHQIVTRKG